MKTQEKKSYLLLKIIILHSHGLDESEQKLLYEAAEQMQAFDELDWVKEFVERDLCSAFERVRGYLGEHMMSLDREMRIDYLDKVWQANARKGYVTELEATSMLMLADDWEVEQELINKVKQRARN